MARLPVPEFPIVQISYQLTLDLHRAIANFPRAEKSALGQTITQLLAKFLEGTLSANSIQRPAMRSDALRGLLATLVTIRLNLRLAKDLRCLSKKQHADYNLRLDDIQRQLTGWLKWTQNKLEHQPKA